MIVLVTPAQQDLARLDVELADRLGEPRDPHMEAIANAPVQQNLATLDEAALRSRGEPGGTGEEVQGQSREGDRECGGPGGQDDAK